MRGWSQETGREGGRPSTRGRWLGMGALVALVALAPAVVTAQEAPQRADKHEVRRGDTLWGLAGRYLTDPFRWREIFQVNTSVVEDPHWIYPGELLTLPDAARVAQAAPSGQAAAFPAALSDAATPARQERPPATQEASRGVSRFGGASLFDKSPDAQNRLGNMDIDVYAEPALVTTSDFYRAPFLSTALELDPVGVIRRKLEANPLHLRIPPAVRMNDRVVIDLMGLEAAPGDVLHAFRWDAGPRGKKIARSMALLEVTDVSEGSARATVVQLFADLAVGDLLMRAEPFPIMPGLSQTPVQDGMATQVIGFAVEQAVLGEGDMVFLAVGGVDGVQIGDEFAVFSHDDDASAVWEDRLATVRVVRVRDESVTARVVDLRDASPEPGAPARMVLRAVGSRASR